MKPKYFNTLVAAQRFARALCKGSLGEMERAYKCNRCAGYPLTKQSQNEWEERRDSSYKLEIDNV